MNMYSFNVGLLTLQQIALFTSLTHSQETCSVSCDTFKLYHGTESVS